MKWFFLVVCSSFLLSCLYSLDQGNNIPVPQTSPYLLKHASLQGYFDVSKRGIRIYASPEDKQLNNVECWIRPKEYGTMRRLFSNLSQDSLLNIYLSKGEGKFPRTISSMIFPQRPYRYSPHADRPLLNLRVAIDPGHIADDMVEAEVEGKYVKMRRQRATGNQSIAFNEANLALATAYLVKEQLENLGAKVMLSRPEAGRSVRGMSFEEWLEGYFEEDLEQAFNNRIIDQKAVDFLRGRRADIKDKYAFFNTMDLRARADKINSFHPHLTLIIHFNVDGPNYEARDRQGFIPPRGRNYLMAFVPGSILKGELRLPEQRLGLLRLLLTDDIERSRLLAEQFIFASRHLTGVPLVEKKDNLAYLDRNCILTQSPGVYARNLRLHQLVNGPICYGESLCQDDVIEAKALNQQDIMVHGIPAPNRLLDVANAYQRAVIRYARRELSE